MHPGRSCFQRVECFQAAYVLYNCIMVLCSCFILKMQVNEAHASRQLVPSGGQFFQEALCIQADRASRKSMLPGSSCFFNCILVLCLCLILKMQVNEAHASKQLVPSGGQFFHQPKLFFNGPVSLVGFTQYLV